MSALPPPRWPPFKKEYPRLPEKVYIPQVTVLSDCEWKRIKGKAKRDEETSVEQQQKKEKADEKKQRNELEAQLIQGAKDRLFSDTESVRRFHSSLLLAAVLKEREEQIKMKQKIKDIEAEHLAIEELERNREAAARDEFQKYTDHVITKAAEANLNLIPLVKSSIEGLDTHGPIMSGIPMFYEPVFEKGERKTAEKHERKVVDVGISGLGFSMPEEPLEYEYPELQSKHIGRLTKQLVDTDRHDKRMNFPKIESEITKFMAAGWSQGK